MKRTAFLTLAVLLVIVTLPLYATISGLSLMAFDGGFSWQAAAFSGTVVGVSLFVPILSLIFSIKLVRRDKPWHGLGISLIPAAVFGIFWLWVSQQSFS